MKKYQEPGKEENSIEGYLTSSRLRSSKIERKAREKFDDRAKPVNQ